MPSPNLVILYVDNPIASAVFYQTLLGRAPIETSATFSMVPLRAEMSLGLWSRHTVLPSSITTGGGTEIAFLSTDIDADHDAWVARGLTIVQPPTDLDFGRTFVALDPDGHRLRVFRPS